MTGREFICARCGETYESGWTEEEALQELKETFNTPVEECAKVCDDCYKELRDHYKRIMN